MQKIINQSRDARKIKYSTKNEKQNFEREKEKENNLLCVRKYVQNERQNCKFIVRGGNKKNKK